MKNLGNVAIALALILAGCSKSNYSLPEESTQFAQNITYNNKVDMIIVVDNSSSMSTYQTKLADQTDSMINELNNFGMDYRIVVVTTDMRSGGNGGLFVGTPKVLDNVTPDLVNVLKNRIKQGNLGSDSERGIMSIEEALTKEVGFLRADALLAILTLSNEDDHSTNNNAHFIEFLDTLKPKFNGVTQSWILNFIGVPTLQSSCLSDGNTGTKFPGLRWIELAEHTGGLVQEICDTTLGEAVTNIRKRIESVLAEFPLGKKPVVESIKVTINGREIPQSNTDGWEYIPDGYRIKLHGSAIPSSRSDLIAIDFTPAEAN